MQQVALPRCPWAVSLQIGQKVLTVSSHPDFDSSPSYSGRIGRVISVLGPPAVARARLLESASPKRHNGLQMLPGAGLCISGRSESRSGRAPGILTPSCDRFRNRCSATKGEAQCQREYSSLTASCLLAFVPVLLSAPMSMADVGPPVDDQECRHDTRAASSGAEYTGVFEVRVFKAGDTSALRTRGRRVGDRGG